MTCTECREALSARLDGEDPPAERVALDAHLDRCADCRRYAERAAQLTRLARTGLVEPIPDLVDAVLVATAPTRRRGVRWETVLRVVLATIGVGQLGLAVGGVLAVSHGGHGGADLSGATLAHFSHESSAWNLALAVGFLSAAGRTRRCAGLVPLVSAFVVVLASLSVLDVVHDRVDGSRLLSHGVVVLGLLVLVVLTRLGTHPVDGMPGARAGAASRSEPTGEPDPVDHSTRSDGAHHLKPTAHHRAA